MSSLGTKAKITRYTIYNIYVPFAQVGPENPTGHAVHIFSSITSQAVHVPPQAEKVKTLLVINRIS